MTRQEYWTGQYKKKRGALWIHDGKEARPHVKLHAGGHSDGYFNGRLVMEDPYMFHGAVEDLVTNLFLGIVDLYEPDRVVGPAMGAITFAHHLAFVITKKRQDGTKNFKNCLFAYTEKFMSAGFTPTMIFDKTRVLPGEKVLLCEDTITTGDTVGLTEAAVLNAGGIVLPYVVAILNRSGLTKIGGKKIVALIDQPMSNWKPEECPLCPKDSRLLDDPKSNEQWDLLNAEY